MRDCSGCGAAISQSWNLCDGHDYYFEVIICSANRSSSSEQFILKLKRVIYFTLAQVLCERASRDDFYLIISIPSIKCEDFLYQRKRKISDEYI